MALVIYNSLSGEKEEFRPFFKDKVGLYVCGPTVYSEVHLGNVRTFVSFDIIYRYLKYLGYKVRYVRNITDVGHLEDDSDDGEDKIAKKAKLENLEPMEIAQKYTNNFHYILNEMNCLEPNIEPLATGHIIDQIEMIEKIMDNGFAYESNGSVYFDVKKYDRSHDYGILSGRNIENQISETRVLEGVGEKKNQVDFALWKKASKEHIMKWKAPWSVGFPGWHLECSSMSIKYLGNKIDIHGGGMDLKFPHHECEIAQNKSCDNESEIKYWVHSNMLTLNGKKMSKSTGNTLLPEELFFGDNILGQNFSAPVVRFFILMSHYRSVLDFSKEAVISSQKGFERLRDALQLLDKLDVSNISDFDAEKWVANCFEAMDDDFNTAVLIAHIFEAVKIINSINDKKCSIDKKNLDSLKKYFKEFCFEILGLSFQNNQGYNPKLDEVMKIIVDVREEIRKNKNWELSDFLRDRLNKVGIQIKDGENKTEYIIK